MNDVIVISVITTRSAQYVVSVRPSRQSTAAAAAARGSAAQVRRGQQISTDSCCCRATCGPQWRNYNFCPPPANETNNVNNDDVAV